MNKLTALIFLVIFAVPGFAQPEETDEMSWRQKLKTADELMEMGSYYNAIDLYREVLEERSDMDDVALTLGNALYTGRNYKEAEEFYKKAYDLDPEKNIDALYYYALMQKMNGKYELALDNFEEYSKNRGGDMLLRRATRYDIESVKEAIDVLETLDTTDIIIRHLSTNVNDIYTEFAPVLRDENELIYSSLKVDSIPVLERKSDKMPIAKLYRSIKTGGEWGEGVEWDEFNDDKEHTGNGSFSQNGQKFYFTRCKDDRGANVTCDIYMSERSGGEWSKPEKMDFNEKDAKDTHPIVVPFKRGQDEEMIIFSSNREGGQGGMDLYFTYQDRSGAWRTRDLRRFNTDGDEVTPFYDWDTDILYYSSNRAARRQMNYGGFDIYASKRRSTTGTSFAYPANIGFPFNSSVDDMYYTHYEGSDKGFFVSNRKEALSPKWQHCCDDIFEFEKIYPPKFTILTHVYEEGDVQKENPLDSANIELINVENDNVTDRGVSESEERTEFYLGTVFANFRLEARKPNYTMGQNTTSTIALKDDDTLYVDIFITPIEEEVPVTLRNVYFDLDSANIRDDAKPSLDSIYNILTANPNIQIELSSHTDSRGSDSYNLELSQRRADSSKAYLVGRGIDEERIVAVGKGETELLNECDDGVPCTELEHQLNRRTEFKIIGEIPGTIITYDKSEIERVQEQKRKGTVDPNRINWDFGDTEDEEEEDQP